MLLYVYLYARGCTVCCCHCPAPVFTGSLQAEVACGCMLVVAVLCASTCFVALEQCCKLAASQPYCTALCIDRCMHAQRNVCFLVHALLLENVEREFGTA